MTALERRRQPERVPEGRPNFGVWAGGSFHLELVRHAGFVATRTNFKRPSGTQIIWMANPAIDRRATIARPSGAK
jgi:hypothetical protein